MNAKAEQKGTTHQSILESAGRLLRRVGINGARVADIMKDAGLTVGGFYAHFSSKTELIDEAIRRSGAQMRARLFARIDEVPDEERIEAVLKRYLCAAHRDAGKLGCTFPAIVGEIGTTAPEHRDALAEQTAALAGQLAQLLSAAEKSGPEAKESALGMIALMYGGLTFARALQGTALSDQMLQACRAVAMREARQA